VTTPQATDPPPFTAEQIAEIAIQAALTAVQQMQPNNDLRLYTPEEAAVFIGKTAWWLEDQVRACTIPHTRIGRTVMFSAEHIRAITAQGEVDPATRRPKAKRRIKRMAAA
jgi:hypothetical protein